MLLCALGCQISKHFCDLNFTLAKADLYKGADLKRIFCPQDLALSGLLGVFRHTYCSGFF